MRARRTWVFGAALTCLVLPLVGPAGAGADPPTAPATADADAEHHADHLDLTGDFVIRPDEGPAVVVPEPGGGRAAGGLFSTNLEGFRSWNATSGNRGDYQIRLVNSTGVEVLRPVATTVATELTAITGATVSVAPTRAASLDPVPDGEIRVVVSNTTPCGTAVIGCGEIQTTNGVGQRGRVWITDAGMGLSTARMTSLLRHEIGHALGLGHYQEDFAGARQVMASGLGDALPYRAGDRNGLRFLAPRCDDRPSDVGASNPFCDEVGWTVRNEILNGYRDGTFRPGAPVSRQALAAMLYRYADSPASSNATGFSDVPTGHPFAREIRWLVDRGITEGYDDGTFRPGAPVSRQAMAAFIHRYLVWRNGSVPTGPYARSFDDVPPGHRFRTPIQSLSSHLVVQGSLVWNGVEVRPVFVTTSPVSRQAVAAFLFRSDNLA